MNAYTLELSGGVTSTILAETDGDAIRQALAQMDGDAVVAEQWDADGWDDDDAPLKRILFWSSEEESEDDPGTKSIAQLITRGNP